MRGWSFRTKLIAVNAAVVVVVLLASGCALLWTSRTMTMAAIDRELEGRAARVRGLTFRYNGTPGQPETVA
ncbi:MAG TPA: hypothetical protein PLL78_05000, partial [Fimbriimonadaceae bacterium]|nr:hypothetical protein [Fimbriimonadaceae bacterium]